MNPLSKVADSIRKNGIYWTSTTILAVILNKHLQPFLPDYTITLNGVLVDGCDYDVGSFPWSTNGVSNYESGLIAGILKHVDEGDSVVVIGGGFGVTATKAAQQVGESGEVIVFEGSSENTDIINRTVSLNGVSGQVEVHHAVVGEEVHVYGETADADYISPEMLPQCDILELDCEGAEIGILEDMEILPDTILVESHGVYNSPTSEVVSQLTDKGYDISHKEIAEEQFRERHIEEDVYVITASFDLE